MIGNRRQHYFGPLGIYFSEEGLHLHDRTSQTRTSWQQFVGYLESGDLMLLYYNSRV